MNACSWVAVEVLVGDLALLKACLSHSCEAGQKETCGAEVREVEWSGGRRFAVER